MNEPICLLQGNILRLNSEVDQLILAKKNEGEIIFNQYDILPKINKFLKKQNESKEWLTEHEKRGLCNGLASYYLYSRLEERQSSFFAFARQIISIDFKNTPLPIEFQAPFIKFIHDVRWLHHWMFNKKKSLRRQQDLDISLEVIREKNDSPLKKELSFSHIFNQEEFLDFSKYFSPGQLVLLHLPGHAMALFVGENEFTLYDPDFKYGDELNFKNLEDLYAWLIFETISYQIEKIDQIGATLALGITIFRQEKHVKRILTDEELFGQYYKDENLHLRQGSGKRITNLLWFSATKGCENAVKFLLKKTEFKFFLDKDVFGVTPLLSACQQENALLARYLLKAGANPNTQCVGNSLFSQPFSPLKTCIVYDHYKVLEELLQYNVELPNEEAATEFLTWTLKASFNTFKLFYLFIKNSFQDNFKEFFISALVLGGNKINIDNLIYAIEDLADSEDERCNIIHDLMEVYVIRDEFFMLSELLKTQYVEKKMLMTPLKNLFSSIDSLASLALMLSLNETLSIEKRDFVDLVLKHVNANQNPTDRFLFLITLEAKQLGENASANLNINNKGGIYYWFPTFKKNVSAKQIETYITTLKSIISLLIQDPSMPIEELLETLKTNNALFIPKAEETAFNAFIQILKEEQTNCNLRVYKEETHTTTNFFSECKIL